MIANKKSALASAFISALFLSAVVGTQFVDLAVADFIPPTVIPYNYDPPTTSVFSPVDMTYYVNYVSLNFTVTKPASWYNETGYMGYFKYKGRIYEVNCDLDGQTIRQWSVSDRSDSQFPLQFSVNLTGLSDGTHSIVISAAGTCYYYPDIWPASDADGKAISGQGEYYSHVIGYSDTIYFIIEVASPKISILSPADKNYSTTDIQLTFTVNEPVSQVTYSLDEQTNVTIAGNTTLTGLHEGTHSIVAYATDIAGKTNSSGIAYFAIDTTAPSISILSLANKTYYTTDNPLNFMVNEPVSWMGYSLDAQSNVTIIGNVTLPGLSYGSHSIVVYANDTAGNIRASETIYFSIEPFPTTLIAAAVAIAATGGATFAIYYFAKNKKTTQKTEK